MHTYWNDILELDPLQHAGVKSSHAREIARNTARYSYQHQEVLLLVDFSVAKSNWTQAFRFRRMMKKKSLSAQTGKKTVFFNRNTVVKDL